MKKVYQTIFTKPDKRVFEDSYAAVLATLMDLELSEVIQIHEYYPSPGDEDIKWEFVLRQWLEEKGWKIKSSTVMSSSEYYIITGPNTKRNITHCCIYSIDSGTGELELIHDPHPSKEGVDDIQYIEKLEYVGVIN